jgi:hypothetical protein
MVTTTDKTEFFNLHDGFEAPKQRRKWIARRNNMLQVLFDFAFQVYRSQLLLMQALWGFVDMRTKHSPGFGLLARNRVLDAPHEKVSLFSSPSGIALQ